MRHLLPIITIAALLCILAACASIGRPEGGKRDEVPPAFVRSTPAPGALRVNKNKIEIVFDENIKLDNPSQKVIVSPAQAQQPSMSANGHKITLELRDTLVPDMTYTIDFGDAIQDLNEGNILDGFALDFATGDAIDTLRISGKLFEARTLEPAQGIIVGVYANLADSAITTLPLERVARTNQFGEFTIRNLKPGDYNVFAINDLNRDYHWDRSEDVAFYPLTVTPTVRPIEVTDTFRSATGNDSLGRRQGIQYLPNDLLLTWFNEGYKAQYLSNHGRPSPRYIDLVMAAPSDTLPELTITSGPLAGNRLEPLALLQANATNDTLRYWLRDPVLVENDTLTLATRYLKTDTADQLTWTTDTLRFNYRDPDRRKKEKEREKLEKLIAEGDSAAIAQAAQPIFVGFNAVTRTQQELNSGLLFEAAEPIDTIDASLVTFEIKQDTLWVPLPLGAGLVPDSLSPLRRRTFMPADGWRQGERYRMVVDSAAVTSIYGEQNRKYTHEFTVKTEDDYCTITFVVPAVSDSAVVELLSSQDQVVATAPVVGHRATFPFMAPATYYARLFIDANGDGEWTTGNIADKRQPEDVYYYPKKITLKKNWEVEQEWNLDELPVDQQKPYEIKKNKPKLKAGQKAPKTEGDDEDDEDEFGQFGSNPFDNTRSGAYGRARDPFKNN